MNFLGWLFGLCVFFGLLAAARLVLVGLVAALREATGVDSWPRR